jgi:hypothetical protein
MKRLLVAVPLVVAASVMTAPAAHADDRVCRGTIGASSIDGNVVVPQNATCRLNGTRIDGNVIVESGAKLVASGVRVGGNIQAESHREVVIKPRSVKGKAVRSTVEGSVQLKQGGGGKILRAVVDSDIQLFTNRGRFEVRGNRVDGNLQCKSNNPRPVGGNNVVQGNKEDQCRSL